MTELPIVGVELHRGEGYLQISSRDSLQVLSSAAVGGGIVAVRHVLGLQVPLSYDNRFPERDLERLAGQLDIHEPYVGLLTAVDLSTVRTVVENRAEPTVIAIVTAGVGNAMAAGGVVGEVARSGTINIVLVVEGNLEVAAAVNAVITATEAKTLALLDAGVKTRTGEQASGTSSDAVVVAWTGRGAPVKYAGTATPIGWAIGRAVRQAIRARLSEDVV